MNVVGLITEYNPFHNGHAYHMEKTKQNNNADFIIVVMSGNYVQRGTPAIIDKYTRAKMALACGADLVLELPLASATASAEAFSYGALSVLNQIGIVDSICFGSEHGDTALLQKVANYLVAEPEVYKSKLKSYLKKGYVFPVARSHALCSCLKHDTSLDLESLKALLDKPNNILGIEYCKAITRLNSPIKATTITRKSNDYHEEELTNTISSATAIRKLLMSTSNGEAMLTLQRQMPKQAYHIFEEYQRSNVLIEENDFSKLLYYKLLYESHDSLVHYLDVSDNLAKRIGNQLNTFTSYSEFATLLKTKEITHTRVQRALLHILLDIKDVQPPSYVRILGLRKSATQLTSALKKNSNIPLITSVAKAYKQLPKESFEQFQLEIKANNLYEKLLSEKSNRAFEHEATKQMIVF